VQAVNIDGPMYVCKAALPALIAHGSGTIVNVASGAALRPLANRTAYCASKAALVMFTKALALELAPLGIRANALCPGVIDTPMVRVSYENAADPEEALREILSRPALARLGTVEEIANAALYLTGEESSYTTGSALVVDGGRAFH
jgi:NAD(P)-dependent dehydrogenase (short-subunit alcohol dehydrogenase family)